MSVPSDLDGQQPTGHPEALLSDDTNPSDRKVSGLFCVAERFRPLAGWYLWVQRGDSKGPRRVFKRGRGLLTTPDRLRSPRPCRSSSRHRHPHRHTHSAIRSPLIDHLRPNLPNCYTETNNQVVDTWAAGAGHKCSTSGLFCFGSYE